MSGLELSSCLSRSSNSSIRFESLLTMTDSLLLANVTQRIFTLHKFIGRRSKDFVKPGSGAHSRAVSATAGLGQEWKPRDTAGVGKALGEILVASLGAA